MRKDDTEVGSGALTPAKVPMGSGAGGILTGLPVYPYPASFFILLYQSKSTVIALSEQVNCLHICSKNIFNVH